MKRKKESVEAGRLRLDAPKFSEGKSAKINEKREVN